MKVIFLLIILLSFNKFSLAFQVPKIEFEYSQIFDFVCSQNSKIKLNQNHIEKAMMSDSRFQKIWDKEGKTLLKTLFEIVGIGHPRKELTAYTTVCNYVPMGSPFLINAIPFLNDGRDSEIGLIQITFHEFIHKYQKKVWNIQKSKALFKFRNETFNVQAHLHLMALEKAVYEKLGRNDLVRKAEISYLNIIKGDYKRSWEIIKKEGRKLFISDFKNSLFTFDEEE
ncbi:MAG: hypothetical protein GY909_18125 [Oligoflexia bacterium]|nr:hypothetical protein [Oligoflexia bacterium]